MMAAWATSSAMKTGERLPFAIRREDGAVFILHYDQVGSLRVIADQHGNVIKEVPVRSFWRDH